MRQLLVLTVAYVVAGRLGLAIDPVEGFATLVWAPSGISLAALLLGGYRLWPGIALGAFATNLWMGAPPLVACGIAAGSTLAAVAGTWALRRGPGFRASLDRFREVVSLAGVAGVVTMVSATVGVTSLALGGIVAAADVVRTWMAWWAGDLIGDLVVAPLVLTWARGPRVHTCPARLAQVAVIGAFLVGCVALVFAQRPEAAVQMPILLPYVLFLPLIWTAFCHGTRGAATAMFVVAVAAVWGTYTEHGAFVRADRALGLMSLDVFLATASLASLTLGAVVSERERSQQALRESEERQRIAVEAAHLGLWFWDVKKGRLDWTPVCKSMHGIGPDEEVSYARLLATLHPDDRERTERAIQRSLVERADFRIEHRVVWPDGSVHWLSILGRPLYDEAGAPDRMLGVTMDITAQKRAEQERAELLERERAALAEAQAATRAKDEFLAVLSHELRTPLQSILGWTLMLKAHTDDVRMVQKGLATIERNVTTQARLIEDLLDVSRIVAGKLCLERRPVDLAKVVEAALDGARVAAGAKSIRIDTTIEPVEEAVLGDPDRLQQVVSNLVSNAVKFTPSGGRVGVRLSRTSAAARIVVEDTGRGIAPDLLPHIFERFRQAEGATTRREGGLGLGLTIVRHLVEAHGGTVQADSAGEGRGATFIVTLPLTRAGRADAAGVRERADVPRSGSRSAALFAGVRVLVVEDDPDTCGLLEMVLRQEGAEVHAVRSVRDALEDVVLFRPHVLLSDIGMPEEDGYVLIRQLRARESAEGGHIPALALTAFASPADREQALAFGFDAHVAKPVSPEDLARAVAHLVGRAA